MLFSVCNSLPGEILPEDVLPEDSLPDDALRDDALLEDDEGAPPRISGKDFRVLANSPKNARRKFVFLPKYSIGFHTTEDLAIMTGIMFKMSGT